MTISQIQTTPAVQSGQAARGAVSAESALQAYDTLESGSASIIEKAGALQLLYSISEVGLSGQLNVEGRDTSGYQKFLKFEQEVWDKFNAGYRSASDPDAKRLENFDALPPDVQEMMMVGKPFDVEGFREHNRVQSELNQLIAPALKGTHFKHLGQVKDPKYDKLKALPAYQFTPEWTAKVRKVIDEFKAAEAAAAAAGPEDTVELSPEAQALADLKQPASNVSASSVALKTLEDAAEVRDADKQKAKKEDADLAKRSVTKLFQPYAPGSIIAKIA